MMMSMPRSLHRTVVSSKEVADLARAILNTEDENAREREHFWVLGLNAKNTVKFVYLVSLGSLTASICHPRETFRQAIVHGTCSIILAHNHPSGDTKPSQEDILLTRRLVQGGELLGIKVLDHVIIGDDHFSFRESGLIPTA